MSLALGFQLRLPKLQFLPVFCGWGGGVLNWVIASQPPKLADALSFSADALSFTEISQNLQHTGDPAIKQSKSAMIFISARFAKLRGHLIMALLLALLHVNALNFGKPRSARLQIGQKIASGQYGHVHLATWDGSIPAIAKCALAANAKDEQLALEYLKVEREVHEAIQASGDESRFARYLGWVEDEDAKNWIVWEQLSSRSEGRTCAESLSEYAGRPQELYVGHGLTPRTALRQLLECVAALHSLGYIHRDVKLENVLLSAPDAASGASPLPSPPSSLKLIDMGSCAFADGCTIVDLTLNRCTDLDPNTSPCSPIYAPPEQFADESHPWAFDVYSCAVCYLRLCLPSLRSDEGLDAFRAELSAAGTGGAAAGGELGDLRLWVREKLGATALNPEFVESLSLAFPGDSLALVGAMLRPDPSRRPSIESLLAHPFLADAYDWAAAAAAGAAVAGGTDDDGATVAQPEGRNAALPVGRPRWLDDLLEGEECEIGSSAFYETTERPLAIRVTLTPPLGLLLEESPPEERAARGAKLSVSEVLEGSAAALSDVVRPGDRLVRIGSASVRDACLEDAMGRIRSVKRGAAVDLGFERACGVDECDVSGTDLDPASSPLFTTAVSAPLSEANAPFAPPKGAEYGMAERARSGSATATAERGGGERGGGERGGGGAAAATAAAVAAARWER